MPKFAPIRDVPQSGISEWESALLNAVKENIEILTGQRGAGVQAVTVDTIRATVADWSLANGTVTATAPAAYSQQSQLDLINNVQALANDVYYLRLTVQALLNQLQGKG